MAANANKPQKGQVQKRHYGTMDPSNIDMREWPNAQDLLDILTTKEGIELDKSQQDVSYWQAAIRWSLLKKYGHCPKELENPMVTQSDTDKYPHRLLQLSNEDQKTINAIWVQQCELAKSSVDMSVTEDADLRQFLTTALSNGRPLRWSILDCGPACQFKLHAHPNIEVIYCVKGSLHGIRMTGSPVTKTFEKETNGEEGEATLKGPDLSHLGRPWKFETLYEGEILVNEVGSIHKSFASTAGDGVVLLTLWGGSHADIAPDQEPTSVSVQGALDKMDERLCQCGGSNGWTEKLSETFLPESERNNK